MTFDIDMQDRVTMFFEIDRVRQKPVGFPNYRQAIIAVMETVARQDQRSAVICGRWTTIEYGEIARHYANLIRFNLHHPAAAGIETNSGIAMDANTMIAA